MGQADWIGTDIIPDELGLAAIVRLARYEYRITKKFLDNNTVISEG